jgi:hypothetical protein
VEVYTERRLARDRGAEGELVPADSPSSGSIFDDDTPAPDPENTRKKSSAPPD